MTTDLLEPQAPIRIDVVQKQYKNGMKLDELARLYDVKPETLEPIVRDIQQKQRKVCNKELHYSNLSKEELVEALKNNPTAKAFKRFSGIASDKEMWGLLEHHGLSHMIQSQAQLIEERNLKIIKALESGATQKEVAKEFKVSVCTVQAAIRNLKRHDLKRTWLTAEDCDRLAEQVKQRVETMTNKEIMKELGITQNQLSKLRRDYGIKPAKRDMTNPFNREKHDGRGKREKEEKQVVNNKSRTTEFQELADRIGSLFEQGMTTEKVIEAAGISRGTYYRVKELHGKEWKTVDGRKKRKPKEAKPKTPHLIYPLDQKEEPPVKETTTASLESAVTAFKPEEVSEVIGAVQKHIEHKKPSTRIINRDKDVWAEYLTARSEEIHDVAHTVDVVLEDGKLIERTVLSYTLEREVTR